MSVIKAYNEEWKPIIAQSESHLNQLCKELEEHPLLPHKKPSLQPLITLSESKPSEVKSMKYCLKRIQKYISSLEYNFTSEKYNSFQKNIGMSRIVSIARSIIRNSLPIRCVEATFVAAYLTVEFEDLVRFPVHFRSCHNGTVYRHIVLFVKYQNLYGSLGLSRKKDLMYKCLSFKSLLELLLEFRRSYRSNGHDFVYVGVGQPFAHSFWCLSPVKWQSLKLDFSDFDSDKDDIIAKCETYENEKLCI